jgi:hypothetical protein
LLSSGEGGLSPPSSWWCFSLLFLCELEWFLVPWLVPVGVLFPLASLRWWMLFSKLLGLWSFVYLFFDCCFFFFVLDSYFSFYVVHGSDLVRVSLAVFWVRSTWLCWSSCDTTLPVLFAVSLCSRRLNLQLCRTSTLGAWFAHAEV